MQQMITGTLTRRGLLRGIDAPLEMLEGRRYARIKGFLRDAAFSSYAGTASGGTPFLAIPEEVLASLGISDGDPIELHFSVVTRSLRTGRIGEDLVRRLDEAGTSLEVLPAFERRQLLTSANEAGSEDVRAARIEQIVRACLAAEAHAPGGGRIGEGDAGELRLHPRG